MIHFTDSYDEEKILPLYFEEDLRKELKRVSKLFTAEAGDIIMDIGESIESIPLVAEGSIKILREDQEGRELDPECEVGDSLGTKMDTSTFGRIAAQSAKQVIIQKMKDAEKEAVYSSFIDRKGEIINGIVQRIDRGDIIVNIGQTEAILPQREQIPKEAYRRGDRIRANIMKVLPDSRGPQEPPIEAREVLIGKKRDNVAIQEVLHSFSENVKAGSSGPDFATDEIIVERGDPVQQILKVADERNCDLIVMGSHGHGALEEALIGSTAKKVIRRSKKPVLVVRLPD